MTITSKHKAILLALALLIVSAFYFTRSSPQKEITNTINALALSASFEGPAAPLAAAAYGATITRSILWPLTITLHGQNETATRVFKEPQSRALLARMRTVLSQFAAHASKIEFVAVDAQHATITLLARGMGREQGREDYFLEEHTLKLQLSRIDGEWRIGLIENVSALEDEMVVGFREGQE